MYHALLLSYKPEVASAHEGELNLASVYNLGMSIMTNIVLHFEWYDAWSRSAQMIGLTNSGLVNMIALRC